MKSQRLAGRMQHIKKDPRDVLAHAGNLVAQLGIPRPMLRPIADGAGDLFAVQFVRLERNYSLRGKPMTPVAIDIRVDRLDPALRPCEQHPSAFR